jgi:Enhancer of polycomb-like
LLLQDYAWLELHNEQRKQQSLPLVPHETFEMLMDRFEKEAFFRTQSSPSTPRGASAVDDDAVCAICFDGECQNANVILFCDLCNLAVHQVRHLWTFVLQ